MEQVEGFESTGIDRLDKLIQSSEYEEPASIEDEEDINEFLYTPSEDDDDYSDLAVVFGSEDDIEEIEHNYGKQGLVEIATQVRGNVMKEAENLFKYTLSKVGNEKIAAGIIANAVQESALNPQAIHDNNTGYGLFGHRLQRRDALKRFIKNSGKEEKLAQIDFTIAELQSQYPGTYQKMMNARSPEDAARIFMTEFERPNLKYANQKRRESVAKTLASTYQVGGYNPLQTFQLNNNIPYSFGENTMLNGATNNYFKTNPNLDNLGISTLASGDPVTGAIQEGVEQIDSKVAGLLNGAQEVVKTGQKIKSVLGTAVSGATSGLSTLLASKVNREQQTKTLEDLFSEDKNDYVDLPEFQNKSKNIWA